MSNSITIKIKENGKFARLITLLKELDYIEIKPVNKMERRSRNKAESINADFFSIAGLWHNRKISATEIRKRAWPAR
ncbi:MAG: hypothetical protein HRU69_05610 [Flammeovirgaceae bacterium]|nr:MAG: hypothetical protein HRU69_05610 [Flammeovirgaceae bacterium]